MALDNNHYVNVLGMYARNGDLGAMEQTMNAFYVDPRVFNETEKNTGYAIMHCAAEGGYTNVMSWLKARGASVRVKASGIWEGSEPIHFAVKKGKFKVIEWLKGQDANTINAKDGFGFTPLQIAIQSGQLEMAKCLKDIGADIHVTDSNGGTLMHIAASYGKIRIMEWLKQEGFDINAKIIDMAATPLKYCTEQVKKEKEEAVEWLKRQIESSVAKVEVVNQKNTETAVQPISYESYLKELGHKTDSIVEEMVPLENKIKALQAELEEKKRKNDELSVDIKKLSEEKIRLEKQL